MNQARGEEVARRLFIGAESLLIAILVASRKKHAKEVKALTQARGNAMFVCLVQQAEDARRFFSWVGDLWCRLMHDDITWPSRGHYCCRRCGRLYPVRWGESSGSSGPEVVETSRREPWQAACEHTARLTIGNGAELSSFGFTQVGESQAQAIEVKVY